MNVRCLFLRRKFVPFLEGGVAPAAADRLERHLAGCPACAGMLERVRAGHEAGRQFGRLGPDAGLRPPEFEQVFAGFVAARGRRHGPFGAGGLFIRALSSPSAVRVLVALVLAQSVLLVVSNWHRVAGPVSGLSETAGGREFRDFIPIAIGEFSGNSGYRIVTEGFVQKVYFDEEEKTLHLRLVELPHKPEPFVICEVGNFSGMTIPREGSHVRVFGAARFDGQPGRGWHEVNPVMNIAVLKR